MTLIEILKQTVHFKHYRNDSLYYETDDGKFTFEVPIKDLGGSSVAASEKASLFMKWIKEAIKLQEMGEVK